MRDRGVYNATVQSVSDARLLVMSHGQFRAAEALASNGQLARSPRVRHPRTSRD